MNCSIKIEIGQYQKKSFRITFLFEWVTMISLSPQKWARLTCPDQPLSAPLVALTVARLFVVASAPPYISLAACSIPGLLFPNKNNLFRGCFYLERVTGIEPVSRPWQGRIITTIRYPQYSFTCRGRESNPHCIATTGF